jgi:outer membrane protein assembly factor BamB
VHPDRTTTSCLLLGPLVAWTCSLSILAAAADARSGVIAAEAAQTFPSEPVWTVEISATPTGSPVAAGDRLFLPLQSGVSARRLTDGTEIWNAAVAIAGTLAASADRVVVPTKDELRVLAAATGEVIWTARVGPLTAPPLLHEDTLVVAAGEQLALYNAADGSQLWSREIGVVAQRPALADKRLYVPVADGRVLKVDLASGVDIWEAQVGINPTEPLVHGDRVFVGTASKYFWSLALNTGKDAWGTRIGASVIGAAATDGTRVYVVALDNLIRAYDRKNGAWRWKKDLRYRPSAGPTVVGRTVSAPGGFKRLQAFDVATGAPGSHLTLAEDFVSVPVFVQAPEGGPTKIVVLSGGLKNMWKLTLAGPPPPAPPTLPIGAVTVLPGTVVPRGALPVPRG